MKQYVALARVSSREQEREGFSLDVQVEALQRYAQRQGGQIVHLYRIAETASKEAERKTFKEMLSYVRQRACRIQGLLFYKVDRAARNIFDYVELERLEAEDGVPVIYVSQPTENTPAGRMQRRILANMASFYTEQQSLDVKEGLARRVQDGLFVGKVPYGYRNVRVDGRSLIEVHPQRSANVQRMFELYAYRNHTLDGVVAALEAEGLVYTDTQPRVPRSKLHHLLRDRSYIGEVQYRGQWLPGRQAPLVDLATFQRVQVLLGEKLYNAHESVYGSGMIVCGYCGRPVVVEVKSKQTKGGEREYRYYRCARYNRPDHPKVRLTQAELDRQALELFSRMKVQDGRVHAWAVRVLQARTRAGQKARAARVAELQRQLTVIRDQKDRLLNLRLLGEIDGDTFRSKQAELTERQDELTLQLEANSRQQAEQSDLAVKAFELSQRLVEKWVTADIPEKRQLLEIVCLNFRLDGVNVIATMRKPFDVLAEGPSLSISRGTGI